MMDWMEHGACVPLRHRTGSIREAVAYFYPDPAGPRGRWRSICNDCPVQCDCYLWGMLAEDHGVWGRTTDAERKYLRRRIAEGTLTLAQALTDHGCPDHADRIAAEDEAATGDN